MVAWLVDPYTNAQAAYKLSKGGTTWADWATYKSGAYNQYLLQAQDAFNQAAAMTDSDRNAIIAQGSAAASSLNTNTMTGETSGSSTTSTNPLDWLSTIGGFFSDLGEANTWLRIGEFVLGAGLIYVGLSHLMAGTAAGTALKKAGSAVKVGALLA